MTDPTNPATIDDVVLERSLTPAEEAAVPAWLDQAWTKLQGKVPGLAARMALPADTITAVDEALVRQVLGTMVERKVRNPDGLRAFTIDDVVRTVDATLSSGQIYATDEELAYFAIPAPSGGLYSIPLGR